MRKRNIILYLVLGLALTGCLQSTAMLGPVITLASTGNVSQAGISYLTNQAIEKEIGMNTVEFVSQNIKKNKNINEDKNKKKYNKNFIVLVQNNFNKTRKKILSQNQSTVSN